MKKINFQKIGMTSVGIAGGFVAANAVGNMLRNSSFYQKKTTAGLIHIGAGVAVQAFLPQNDLIEGASYGLIGDGVLKLVKGLGLNLDAIAGLGGEQKVVYVQVPVTEDPNSEVINAANRLAGLMEENASILGVQEAILGAEEGDPMILGL